MKIATKAGVQEFMELVKKEGNFTFNDSKSNYSEHITQLIYDVDNTHEWRALLSSNLSMIEDISNIEKWVWERRADINKELRSGNYKIPKIHFTPTFETKRIHFKGRGQTEYPTCPQCGKDMQSSYIRKRVYGHLKLIKTGWECADCKYKQWD